MTDKWLQYFEGMTPEQMQETLRTLTPQQRSELIAALCCHVNQIATSIVQRSEHVWLTGELPEKP